VRKKKRTSKTAEDSSALKPARLDIRAVAKHANVSIATVSRVTNHVPTVAPHLAEKVWQVVRELNYSPNAQARALVSGRSRVFGVLISEITNPFFPELIQGFEEVAVELGYELLIGSTNYNLDHMKRCVQRMLDRKVDGVAVMTFGIESPLLDHLAAHDIPLVFIDVAPKTGRVCAIQVDYDSGIRQAVQHLATLGHRDIAFITGPLQLGSAQARRDAFLAATKEIGIKSPSSYLCEGDHTLEGGINQAQKLFRLKLPPTAIMCSNDMTAMGVLHAAAHFGLRIPTNLSVVGFDDIDIARYCVPPLSTVRMSRRKLARAAFMALKSLVDGTPKDDIVVSTIQTELVVRESTASPSALQQAG
jgi:DNA-binding LacI/PurR family transcriptional regulator